MKVETTSEEEVGLFLRFLGFSEWFIGLVWCLNLLGNFLIEIIYILIFECAAIR